MRKVPESEHAKALMSESQDWSIWRWLLEKSSVRKAADQANAALAAEEASVKSRWSADLKRAYAALDSGKQTRRQIELEIVEKARRIKEADDEAERVRLDAEATFDEADRRLSTSLAREGAQKAIQAWLLREKAIRKAEKLVED